MDKVKQINIGELFQTTTGDIVVICDIVKASQEYTEVIYVYLEEPETMYRRGLGDITRWKRFAGEYERKEIRDW